MAYIGKQPVVGNFVKLDAITTSATATYNLTNGGVAYFPHTANNCIVSLNGVIQSPTSAYTISGSTIVFSDALTASDSIDFILVLGDVLSIGTPSDGTVTAAKLASGTVGLIAWQSVQTTGFTASAGRGYPCNTTSAAFTVTLPASPSVGDTIILLDYAGTFATNNITLGRNGNNIEGGTNNKVLNTNREAVSLTYVDSTQGWVASSGVNEGSASLSGLPYSVDFLVVAGGGGACAGGGGAGGYRTSTQTVSNGTVITVTVGDGGASASYNNNAGGTNGSNSSISGSGLTTITSTGGGGGGRQDGTGTTNNGKDGGSGGGSGRFVGATNSTVGLGNTPSTSPSQGNNGGSVTGLDPNYGSGGGGGAGAVGSNGTSSSAGNGGNGTANSITGSSVTRAGGGSGNADGGTAGTGGTGGGGNGGIGSSSAGTAGTANTGGGGGAGVGLGSGAGGKGVVILSVPTASYSSTTTGSPTVTTSGSNTILQFNGSGSYTA